MDYGYFDEAYFQTGQERGTAYRNYLTVSPNQPIFAEIAEACFAFRPRRALEIGCATGVVVRRLNDKGVEAHGIDVSKWAIGNRQHPNVILAGAEDLPFPDNHFDFVYSTHSLEHIPTDVAERAFREMGRVSAPNATHFHTLPVLGRGPYLGDPAVVTAQLKNDPTHNLLFDEAWWLAQFNYSLLGKRPLRLNGWAP
jgi:ubiquinone/menaquinone biosynthesis C-methylase UbiE